MEGKGRNKKDGKKKDRSPNRELTLGEIYLFARTLCHTSGYVFREISYFAVERNKLNCKYVSGGEINHILFAYKSQFRFRFHSSLNLQCFLSILATSLVARIPQNYKPRRYVREMNKLFAEQRTAGDLKKLREQPKTNLLLDSLLIITRSERVIAFACRHST
mgnify:CR=1 FL=1